MTINKGRRALLQAIGLGSLAPYIPAQGFADFLQPSIALVLPETSTPISSTSTGRLFTLKNHGSLDYGGEGDLPLCLAFGERAHLVVQGLIDAPVFGYAGVSGTANAIPNDVLPEGVTGSCDWIAFVIDAEDPSAIPQANAAARAISKQDIFLRFALVLEGEEPYELKELVTLNETLDGIVLIGKCSDYSEPAVATATGLLEYFLVPCGLVGIDLGDVRAMLRNGLGIHRAVSAFCTSTTLIKTMRKLVAKEPIAEANTAMVWIGARMEFGINDYDTALTEVLNLAPDASFMLGLGYTMDWTLHRTHLVMVWG